MAKKKSKIGKQRRDNYYHKAKIAGFRARSAFKLIQLNTKYEFLQKSRVCIDLCAAPGSWMQVAKKFMPVSSIIVGVDLFPIKVIPGTLSVVGDITTEKVRQDLKSTLKTWKADLILHDGAPNVGKNWLHDAYQQNLLVLHAFKLACEFLQKGGIFVTKVFRSKDFYHLEYVFKKLFKKVETTKPQASRYESAEIFVVCQGYLNPDKIDPQFFSAKHVFQELHMEPNTKLNILRPDKSRSKAEGYAEGATTLYNRVPVTKFIHSTEYIEILQEASEFAFNDETIRNHKLTTDNIVENCKDIKVLGRKDLRQLLTWRKNIKEDLKKMEEEKAKALIAEKITDEEEEVNEEDELTKLQQQVLEMKTEQARDEKRAMKRKLKEKKKLEEKMRLQLLIPGDSGPTENSESGLFSLQKLSQMQDVDAVLDQEGDMVVSDCESEKKEKEAKAPKYVRYNKDEGRLDKTGSFYISKEEEELEEEEEDDDGPEEDVEGLGFKENDKASLEPLEDNFEDDEDVVNPLLTDLLGDSREARRARKAENWFSQDVFKDLETEADEDYELDAAIRKYEEKGGKLLKKEPKKVNKKTESEGNESGYTSDHSDVEEARDAPDSDSDTDSDEEPRKAGPQLPGGSIGNGITKMNKKRKGDEAGLDPVGLALATKMIHSKKAKRDLMDAGWNRYMFGDEDDLPEWFSNDEKKFNTIRVEVDPEDLRMYRDQAKNVNAKTIKKVVEAKARKQRRVKKQMAKARKKAENVTNNANMSEREKAQEVKKLYKRAMTPLKKKETSYVVMKKRHGGKKPKGTKGPYKLVDKRMKKDARAMKKAEAKKNKKGVGLSKSSTKGKPKAKGKGKPRSNYKGKGKK